MMGSATALTLIACWLIAVAPPATADDAELRELVMRQGREIEALKQQIGELTKILGTRLDEVEKLTADGRVVMTGPSPRLESADGDFSLAIVGGLQPTAALYDQDSQGTNATTQSLAPDLSSGADFRRAQIGIQGTAFRDFG
jgi:phosphate-selective porin OprO/OprP